MPLRGLLILKNFPSAANTSRVCDSVQLPFFKLIELISRFGVLLIRVLIHIFSIAAPGGYSEDM